MHQGIPRAHPWAPDTPSTQVSGVACFPRPGPAPGAEVPAGQRVLRATHIDHAPLDVQVSVPSGGRLSLDFALRLRPVQLPVVFARAAGIATARTDTVSSGIGGLGPDPRGLAVWNVGAWENLDRIVRELDGVDEPVRLVTAGLYRDLGHETL